MTKVFREENKNMKKINKKEIQEQSEMVKKAVEKSIPIINKYHVADCKSKMKQEYFYWTLVFWSENNFGNAFETYLLNRIVGQARLIAAKRKFDKNNDVNSKGNSFTTGIFISNKEALQVLPFELKSLYNKAIRCEADDLEKESRIIYDWLFEK